MPPQRPKKLCATGQANTKPYNQYKIHRHGREMEVCSFLSWRQKVNQKDLKRQSWPNSSFWCWLQPCRDTHPPTLPMKVVALHKHYKWLKITWNFTKLHGMLLLLLPAPKCLAQRHAIKFCTLCQSLPKVFMWSTQAKWTEHLYSIC